MHTASIMHEAAVSSEQGCSWNAHCSWAGAEGGLTSALLVVLDVKAVGVGQGRLCCCRCSWRRRCHNGRSGCRPSNRVQERTRKQPSPDM